jgi:hypothetical protein
MAQAKTPRPQPDRYQLKVTLLGPRPAIWRRLVVPSDVTLDEVHWIIQVAMPWNNSHLHQFHDPDGQTRYSDPRFELEDVKDEGATQLNALLRRPKDAIVYEYDFGDGWEHRIALEKVVAPSADPKRALECTGGKRAAPPDDCGGVGGYEDLVDAVTDEDHERHEELLEWLGGEFDPEAFDVEETNRRLKKVFRL